MTRTVLRGGSVFDGTGSLPAPADVAIEAGRIVGLEAGLDGDEEVDVRGRTILPGLFDCHVHVCVSSVDIWGAVRRPFSWEFFDAARNLRATLATGITSVRDDRLGTIEGGKLADQVVVVGRPLEVSDLAGRIEQVWQAGARVV